MKKPRKSIFAVCMMCSIAACNHISSNVNDVQLATATTTVAATSSKENKKEERNFVADAATILAKKEIPILCYHQLRDWRPTDSKTAKDYIVPVANFSQQMKLLADSGYHTILPDQLMAYLTRGEALPSKPVMLTFDDTDDSQYQVALPEMRKYGFKGVFFIMTVSIGRPGYMNKDQIKELVQDGHVIGSHTWDHHSVKQYAGNDWQTQLDKPLKQLENITGKEIKYFAYPFGLWNTAAIPEIKKRNMIAAFQLYAKRNSTDPLYTIRRMIVPGAWDGVRMETWMKRNFK
jgi:peptidoglycan/xylan/chitin deacetylase (PgdA/CDA1 family)